MMSILSLATVTRVDPTVEKGKIHRQGDAVVFHSERERKAWLWAVEQYERREEERLYAESRNPLRHAEQALMGLQR
jgi:hypothetical protein